MEIQWLRKSCMNLWVFLHTKKIINSNTVELFFHIFLVNRLQSYRNTDVIIIWTTALNFPLPQSWSCGLAAKSSTLISVKNTNNQSLDWNTIWNFAVHSLFCARRRSTEKNRQQIIGWNKYEGKKYRKLPAAKLKRIGINKLKYTDLI